MWNEISLNNGSSTWIPISRKVDCNLHDQKLNHVDCDLKNNGSSIAPAALLKLVLHSTERLLWMMVAHWGWDPRAHHAIDDK